MHEVPDVLGHVVADEADAAVGPADVDAVGVQGTGGGLRAGAAGPVAHADAGVVGRALDVVGAAAGVVGGRVVADGHGGDVAGAGEAHGPDAAAVVADGAG